MIEFHEFAGAGFQLGDAVIQPGTEGLILVETAEQSAEALNCLAGLQAPGRGASGSSGGIWARWRATTG